MVLKDRKYTNDHEWALREGDNVRVGITDHAQKQLGDIVFVELPQVGLNVGRQEQVATLESVKAVGEVTAPVSGEIIEVNESLLASPDLVNKAPYEDGWVMVLRADDPAELDALLDAAAYEELTKEG